jgi:hypothetical protein
MGSFDVVFIRSSFFVVDLADETAHQHHFWTAVAPLWFHLKYASHGPHHLIL